MGHTVDSLAEALYEGHSSLANLAEEMARQYGKAGALTFFSMMSPGVQWFWKDIARRIIKHSREWNENDGSACVLSDHERNRLMALRSGVCQRCKKRPGDPIVLCGECRTEYAVAAQDQKRKDIGGG